MTFDAETLQLFRDEALERLAELETCLLGLDASKPDAALIDQAFRSLHTIKGSGAMFGLERLVEFSHLAESLFSRIRDGSLALSTELIELGLQVKDVLHLLLPGSNATETQMSDGLDLRDAISALLPSGLATVSNHANSARAVQENCQDTEVLTMPMSSWRIRWTPGPDMYRSGTNPLQLIKDLGELGRLVPLGSNEAVPDLESIDPEQSYLSWEFLLRTELGGSAIRDVFIFVENESILEITKLDDGIPGPGDFELGRLGRYLAESGQVPADIGAGGGQATSQALNHAVEDWLAGQGFINQAKLKAFRNDLNFLQAAKDPRVRHERDANATIKVPTAKLDALVNLVGELVTMQSRYRQLAVERRDDELNGLNEEMDGLTRGLRNLAMDMHMVPLELLFSSYQRLIRDLGRQLGKQVRMETVGTDTELEKNIIEELKDPLLHLIRNSMDHGLETAAVREAAGKDPVGTLSLEARYEGASVIISVADDGAGLNSEAILKKAIERQLVGPDARLSVEEIHQLIFLPGFSTAATVSDVSGRGVGMDVVKKSIEALRGSISLHSRPGQGTEIRLRIPLSLSVVEALLVRVGEDAYAVNLNAIVACRAPESLQRMASGDLVVFEAKPVPCIDLLPFFSPGDVRTKDGVMIFLSDQERTIGVQVDEVQNTIQAVIKPLGKAFMEAKGVNGAVVLGDGSLALVLDTEWFLAGVNARE